MKHLLLASLLVLSSSIALASNEPTLVLEVHSSKETEMRVVSDYLSDDALCCIFEVKSTLTDSTRSYTQIKHRETGVVLGTFYGTPSKDFILKIYREQFTPAYIEYVVPKIVSMTSQN
jgi:hypothetical protein